MQLLQMFKTGVSQSTSCKSESPRGGGSDHDSGTIKDLGKLQVEKSDVTLSPSNTATMQDLQIQLKDLQEKLRFANETIALMEDKKVDSGLQKSLEEIKNDDSLISDDDDDSTCNKSAKISKLIAQQSFPKSSSTHNGLATPTDTPVEIL